MAEKEKMAKEPMPPINVWLPPVALGWLVPGGGHFLLKRTGRALLLAASITCMFALGLAMRGAMFASGILYLLTTWLGYSQPDVAGQVHDYGTKFLVTAGLLNVLAMVDAYEIAGGRKS
jgi:hypothetical protein